MIMYAVKFWNTQNGDKQYREYPKIAQFSSYKGLLDFLHKRTFLIDYIVDEIKKYNMIRNKMQLAEKLGTLIYGS